ncbi:MULTISPECIES: hypothetical protein [unclassified Pseudomonas]|uniref:hypothetical protein n=1 Tax=unclassified Pseudomonas TaxID=196821 RepID=UPI00381582A6
MIEATEYVLCGLAVAHQAITTLHRSPATIMTMTVMHEMEAVRTLLESAIAHLKLKGRRPVCTLH